MKKVILLIIIFLLFTNFTKSQKWWEWISNYPSSNIPSFSCEKDGYVFYGGFPKSFFFTYDGGDSFISRSPFKKISDTQYFLTDRIAATDSNTIIILDDEGIFRTTNGGVSWSNISDFGGGHNMTTIGFNDNLTGWMIGGGGIRKTIDGGASWYYINSIGLFDEGPGLLAKIQALNNNYIFVISKFNSSSGGRVNFSSNGGVRWINRSPLNSDSSQQVIYTDIKIRDDGTGLVLGSVFYPTTDVTERLLFKTSDFGNNWERIIVENYFNAKHIVLKNEQEWFVIGSQKVWTGYNQHNLITMRTIDAGNTWEYRETIGSNQQPMLVPTTAEYVASKNTLIVSTYSGFYRSTDSGESYHRLSNGNELIVTDFALEKNNSGKNQLAIAITDGDSILISENGGRDWKKKYLPPWIGEPNYDGTVTISNGVIYLVTNGRNIYKSTDKAENWEYVYYSSGWIRKIVSFDGTNIAYSSFSGLAPVLYYSNDSGNSWSITPRNTGTEYDLVMTKPSEILSCGESYDSTTYGYIYFTNDGGYNWRVIDTKNKLHQVYVLNDMFSFAIGSYEIYRTTNKRGEWTKIKSTNDYFTYFDKMVFKDSLNGVLKISYKYFTSTNAGLSWNESNLSFPFWGQLKKMEYNNSGDLIILENGSLAILKNPDLNSEQKNTKENLVYVNDFELYQNYPNPFNPVTKISYALPSASMVDLKVYNILGQLITTLVNEEKPAGFYEVDFNAADLPSGVYMYRLQVSTFTETRKMILIR